MLWLFCSFLKTVGLTIFDAARASWIFESMNQSEAPLYPVQADHTVKLINRDLQMTSHHEKGVIPHRQCFLAGQEIPLPSL